MLTILDGTTFCISDAGGDVHGGITGLYAEDTRYLSRLELRVDGRSPLLLTAGKVEHFSAAFYLRNEPTAHLPSDTLSISRERVIGSGMTERVAVRNEGMAAVAFALHLTFESDFADILTIKAHDFSFGDPPSAPPLPPSVPAAGGGDGTLAIDDGRWVTDILLSRPACPVDGVVAFDVNLAPHEEWELVIEVLPRLPGRSLPPAGAASWGGDAMRQRDSHTTWQLRVPRLETSWSTLARTFERAVQDLAALRIAGVGAGGELPAAGMPWFMTVFGRDTVVTCLETFLLGPELARSALQSLAALQADREDSALDAEPGKIVHELRRGRAAETWFPVYYGTVDATPLFLVLLSELWRWTDDPLLVTALREPALRALAWIDEWGDRDGDGLVEYERGNPRGLRNQSWKDSEDSQRFFDGRIAEPPIAPVEVQGYVYDAKLRCAELARDVWREPALAERLERDAEALRTRFDEAFWVEEHGGFYALALDAEKRPVDSPCSNMGHLLWSGIVPAHRVRPIVDQLLGDRLWSGWGVRTMASHCAAYNPIGYHTGTVWPHDTMLTAAGLARSGHWEEAWTLVRALLQAAAHVGWSLPEVFAGYPRASTAFPIAYPTASQPQAWAAGAAVLALQVLLGLRPERRLHRIVSDAPDTLPEWVRPLQLRGVRAFDARWNIAVEGGRVTVERS